MQDLVRGIKKVVDAGKAKPAEEPIAAPGVRSLLRRAQLFLEDGDFKSAAEYADRVLDLDPESSPAYLVRLQAGLQVRHEEDLGQSAQPLTEFADYEKAVRFAQGRLKEAYEGYNQRVVDRLQAQQVEEAYQGALRLSQGARDEGTFLLAAQAFEDLTGYRDADEKERECRTRAEELRVDRLQREEAARAVRLRREEEGRLAAARQQSEKAAQQERARLAEAKRRAKNRRTAMILIPLLAAGVAVALLVTQVVIPKNNYQAAKALLDGRQYDQAAEAFRALGGFSDSAAMVKEADYQKAKALRTAGEEERGLALLATLGDYSDSRSLLAQAQADILFDAGDYPGAYAVYAALGESYQTHDADYARMYGEALTLLTQGKQEEAIKAFASLGTYRDSQTRILQAQADQLYDAGDSAGAQDHYAGLGEAYHTHEGDYAAKYAAAETHFMAGEFESAIRYYVPLGTFRDSADKLNQARYVLAQSLAGGGELSEAEAVFAQIPDYLDVPDRLQALRLTIADEAFAAKEYETALSFYLALPQTEELKARVYALAQTCYDTSAYGVATRAYELLGRYELSLSKLPVARYAHANQLFQEKQYAAAAEQFKLLGSMTDSAERMKEASYQYGLQLLEQSAYDEAKALFLSIKGHGDADTQAKEAEYRKATALAQAGSHTEAASLFDRLAGYRDNEMQANASRYALAQAALAAGDNALAQQRFAALGTYSDSEEKARLSIHQQAEALLAAGDYAGAEKLYSSIPGYQDSNEKAKQCRYQQGKTLYLRKSWRDALDYIENLGYGDSDALAAECHLALGDEAQKAGRIDAAVGEYAQGAILPQAQEKLLAIGKDFIATNQHEKAIQTLWAARGYAPAVALLKELGTLLEQNGKAEHALMVYLSMGSTQSVRESRVQLVGTVQPDALYSVLGRYSLLPESLAFQKECVYQYANDLTAAQRFTDAAPLFLNLQDYRDTAVQLKDNAGLAAAAAEFERKWSVGNTVTFGQYEQDNNTANGKEPIAWRVLKREGSKALLISVDNLDCQPYNERYTDITWEGSTLRKWLNGTFLNAAFTPEESKNILTSDVKNADNPEYSTDGGNDTRDRVFLLSIGEAESLFKSDADRVAKNTAYAKAQGAYTNDSGAGWWWLRSPGNSRGRAASVSFDGSVFRYGYGVHDDNHAVRPALWLDLSSF